VNLFYGLLLKQYLLKQVLICMTLSERIKSTKFRSPQHEALLALLVAATDLRTAMDSRFSNEEITPEQYNILRILRGVHPEGHSCGEIASRMIDRSPDITRRIDALVKKGLASREKLKEDRRVVVTRITKKGLDLMKKIDTNMFPVEDKLSDFISDKESKELVRLCEKFIDFQP
jgi:DNA-binding MarR family transcriptional regulator